LKHLHKPGQPYEPCKHINHAKQMTMKIYIIELIKFFNKT